MQAFRRKLDEWRQAEAVASDDSGSDDDDVDDASGNGSDDDQSQLADADASETDCGDDKSQLSADVGVATLASEYL